MGLADMMKDILGAAFNVAKALGIVQARPEGSIFASFEDVSGYTLSDEKNGVNVTFGGVHSKEDVEAAKAILEDTLLCLGLKTEIFATEKERKNGFIGETAAGDLHVFVSAAFPSDEHQDVQKIMQTVNASFSSLKREALAPTPAHIVEAVNECLSSPKKEAVGSAPAPQAKIPGLQM